MSADVLLLEAPDILSIPVDQPERLFTGNPITAKGEYRKLATRWHEDKNPGVDRSVMGHINALYDKAVEKLAKGAWILPGTVTFTSSDNRQFVIRYRKHIPFVLGDCYIGMEHVVYSIRGGWKDLVHCAKYSMMQFKFANDEMRKECARYLPVVFAEFKTSDGYVIVFKKTPDMIFLRDLLAHVGTLDSKHVAWIMSSLYNLACYLQYTGLVHNDISPDTYLVSPAKHSGILVGGWWFSSPAGKRMIAAPRRTLRCFRSKTALPRTDLELIKMTGRELLGDASGSRLLADPSIPRPMTSWLMRPSSSSAIDEYKGWQDVLKDSFGARRFVKLEVSPSDIYK